MAELVAVLARPSNQQLLGYRSPQRRHQCLVIQAGDRSQHPVGHPPAGYCDHLEHGLGPFGQRLDPATEQIAQGRRQVARAGPHDGQELLGEVRVALRPGEHAIHQVGGWCHPQDADQLRQRLDLVQPGQLQALDRAAAVQLGQVRPEPLLARLVVAVGDHQQHPLPPQVPDQKGQQVPGGAIGPVQILHHHQHQRRLLAQPPQQPEQQLEQPGLSGLARRTTLRLAKGGQQAGKLTPGGADKLADGAGADIGKQAAQGLHERRVRERAVADRDATPGQHPGPIGGATGGQLGHQAGLADAGLAPHQDDGRISVCGPHPGRLQELQLLDPADQGRALHAVAHLAGIIPRDRPERNGGRKEPAAIDGESVSVRVGQVPDSGDAPRRHSELASDDRILDQLLDQAG